MQKNVRKNKWCACLYGRVFHVGKNHISVRCISNCGVFFSVRILSFFSSIHSTQKKHTTCCALLPPSAFFMAPFVMMFMMKMMLLRDFVTKFFFRTMNRVRINDFVVMMMIICERTFYYQDEGCGGDVRYPVD